MLPAPAASRIGLLLADSEQAPSVRHPRLGASLALLLAGFLVVALHAGTRSGSFGTPPIRLVGGVATTQRHDGHEDPRMEFTQKLGAAASAAALSLGATALAQDAVQWRVEDGGNGHWYGRSASPTTWDASQAWARAHGGNLASITSAAEISAIQSLSDECWIGARKLTGLPWEWADGEGWNFTNWCPGEPCCFDGGLYVHASPTGCWDDHNQFGTQRFGLIEWSADCNSDGIVDFGQIRAGELEDTNHNNIPDCCEGAGSCNCPGDVAPDGVVNGIDLAAVLNNWGTTGGVINADANRDGTVDANDLAIVLGGWGACP